MIPDSLVEALLLEDAPQGDLTTRWLGLDAQPGRLTLMTRQDGVAAALDIAEALAAKAGARVVRRLENGQSFVAGAELLTAEGPAQALHLAWKPIQSLVEHAGAVATRTARLVALARAVNPRFGIFGTRKHFPGLKALILPAVEAGGGFIHRHGNSETILLFAQHQAFFSSRGALLDHIRQNSWKVCEKKIFVEVGDEAEGLEFLQAGADGLQFDKVPADRLAEMISFLRSRGFDRTYIAAGGIHDANVADYARTGAAGAATSWVYDGRPLDLTTKIIQV